MSDQKTAVEFVPLAQPEEMVAPVTKWGLPAQESALPSHNAQMHTQHIMQGALPQFDQYKPYGYQTIECNHAHEAEMWSDRLRKQSQRLAEMDDYERETAVEGPMRNDLRRELNEKIRRIKRGDGSQNKGFNIAFMEHALKMLDEQEEKAKTIHESYLHLEAYEAGR